MARPKNQKESPYGLECVEEMVQENGTLKVDIFTSVQDQFPQRSSLSWITTRNRMDRTKGAKSGMNLQKKTLHIVSTQNLRTASQRFPARCCRSPSCCSSPWQTYSSHEKLWHTSANCLCLQIQFWFPLHIYLVVSWLWDFQYGAQFWCSVESNFLGQMIFHLVAKCNSRQSTRCVNCKNSSVSFSQWSTVRRQPLSRILASVQNLITRFCCESLSHSFLELLHQIFLRKIKSRRV